MRVLVACEFSGVVRRAFRERGHEAFSCDLLPSEDNSPYHIQDDALSVIYDYTDPVLNDWSEPWPMWDLMIAHPPCTYLCNSGVRWLKPPKGLPIYEDFWDAMDREELQKVANRWSALEEARDFFLALWSAPIPKICIENPVPHKYAELPKYSQTIQPWMFGEDASKRTCLWLRNLESLVPTDVLIKDRYANQTPSGQNKLGPSKTRALERSRSYEGIWRAAAEQWG